MLTATSAFGMGIDKPNILSELALAARGLVQLNRRLQRPCGDKTKR
jgi:hypothetical protein